MSFFVAKVASIPEQTISGKLDSARGGGGSAAGGPGGSSSAMGNVSLVEHLWNQ